MDAPRLAAGDALVEGRRLTALATPHPVERDGRTVAGWAAELADTAASVAAAGRSVIVAVPDRRDLDHLASVLAAFLASTAS